MKWSRRKATLPGSTLRAYLTPERCWALPLDHAGVKDPQTLLDEGFADSTPYEQMAVRFIIEPADASTIREARAVADRLRAERYWWPDELGAVASPRRRQSLVGRPPTRLAAPVAIPRGGGGAEGS